MLSTLCHFQGLLLSPRGSRKTSHRPEPQLRHVELAEFNVAEVDPEEVLVHLLKAEIFKREHLADEDPVLVPADISARVHAPGLEASWIGELTDSSGQQDGAALVETCRHGVVDSFVRPLVVEDLPEAIELLLLQP